MTLAVLAIFAIAYAGLALGRVPGLALDRAGMAVVAAILLVAIGAVPPAPLAPAAGLAAPMASAGWRPLMLLVVETVWMAGLVLAAVFTLNVR